MTPEQKEEILKNNENVSKFVDLLEAQNSTIIKIGSNSYNSIHENFEVLGKNIVKLEDQIKKLDKKLSNPTSDNKGHIESEEFKTIPQIDHEISELNYKITESDKSIKLTDDLVKIALQSVPTDDDFMNKIMLEKKTIVDSIKESLMIKITYQDNFLHDYQYDLMQIILQEINKFRFDERVLEAVEVDFKHVGPVEQKKEGLKIKNRMITENYKVNFLII